MYLEDLNFRILKVLSEGWRNVISLDIETDVRTRGEFLTDEYILSIALASRRQGSLLSATGIETEVLMLEEQTEEAEINLLNELNSLFGKQRPLGLVGYGFRGYDIPLLLMKCQKYKSRLDAPLWKVIDALQQAAHVDLYAMLKTWYRVKNFREAVSAEAFHDLPLKREKGLVSNDFKNKGEDIVRMWREDHEAFLRYAEGDVVDTLLIAEQILKTRA